jgi:hypothetical protein
MMNFFLANPETTPTMSGKLVGLLLSTSMRRKPRAEYSFRQALTTKIPLVPMRVRQQHVAGGPPIDKLLGVPANFS